MNTAQSLPFDLSYLRSIDPADDSFFKSMITQFLDQAPASVNAMKRFLEAGDWAALYKAAHKFKPDAACVGAVSLEKLVARIEDISLNKKVTGSLRQLIDELDALCKVICKKLENEIN